MLNGIKFLSLLLAVVILSFYFVNKSLFLTLLHSELLIIIFVSTVWVAGCYFNNLIFLGLGMCVLMLGGLEIALVLLLLLL